VKILNFLVFLFFIVWVIVVWVGVAWALRMGWKSFKKDFRGKPTRISAKVIHKDERLVFLPHSQDYTTIHELTFECQDGSVAAFDVPERLFLHVAAGEEGILVRHGGRFLAFEGPSGSSESEDDLYRRLVRS